MRIRYLFVLLCALVISPLCFGQWYESESKFQFDDTGEKPQKKTPARKGNFEVIQGRQVKAPINIEKFKEAAKVSVLMLQTYRNYDMTIHQEGTGFIFFRARRTPAWVDIKLCYWDDEYWYEYWDSYRFVAVPSENKIHKTYRGVVIDGLERLIRQSYK